MKKLKFSILFVSFTLCLNLYAQEQPPINTFSPKDYGGESQNWSIAQTENRYIYIANNKGLLEYNGAKWTLYESPNETIIRSVKVIGDLIYTGSYHEFGFWKRDGFGILNYTSLSQNLNVDILEDEEFWNILYLDNSILFQSLDRIHIYNTKTEVYNIVSFDGTILKLFKVGNNFYFQSKDEGLFIIKNGEAVLVSDDALFRSGRIVNIYENAGELLLIMQDEGFVKLNNGIVTPWIISALNNLNDCSIFSSIRLSDGSFALGTIAHGVLHINTNGDLDFKIEQSDGLSNNTVLCMYEDIDGSLWLGLDNGINCINLKSPYSIYHDKTGTIGSVYTSILHQGFLYLGTNQGLFYKQFGSKDNFTFLKGTQGQVWFLGVFDNTLFCGHNSGTYTIKDNIAKRITNIQGSWLVHEIDNNHNRLLQGNYDGLHILEKVDGEWYLKHKIQGFDISSRYFEFLNKNELYLSHEYKGVFKLKLNEDYTKVLEVVKDTFLSKGHNSCLVKHSGDILYSNKEGVFKYNNSQGVFHKDEHLSGLIDVNNFTSGKLVSDKFTDKLWSFNAKGINYISSSKLSGEKRINTIPFPEDIRRDVVGYESVTPLQNENFLIGSRTGYIVLNLDENQDQDHKIALNKIAVSRLKIEDSLRILDLDDEVIFENDENNIHYAFSISEFLKTQQPEYQYKLEGLYDSWSGWITDGNVLFENLPHGNYKFQVRGRVGNKSTLNIASHSFSIKRPWFLTNMAIALYVLGVLLFSLFMHTIYKRYYRKQRERLMLKTTKEFELKELENKQQLMRFRNEKLREDIESKNRELGISTMSLIKKNEFLSTLKSELEDINETKDLKKVIKIIDRNLNNNDDWNLFQEAFNNADKDFLKKIKSIHPSLTSNDLRLCAYLRLNLSSKEIAPLLNISPRSVEVKRYRLRKKMGLPHESSLTDYILEV